MTVEELREEFEAILLKRVASMTRKDLHTAISRQTFCEVWLLYQLLQMNREREPLPIVPYRPEGEQ